MASYASQFGVSRGLDSGYVNVGVLLAVGIALLAGVGALNHLLAPSRVAGSEGFRTYESGVDPVGEG